MLQRLIEWIRDPFGRTKLKERHEPIIHDMIEVRSQVKTTVRRLESRNFPIASTVGRRHGRAVLRND